MNLQALQKKIARLRSGGRLRVLDLFAGCGGLSLGFHAAGCDIEAAVEFDKDAAQSHGRNFHAGDAKHCRARDITWLRRIRKGASFAEGEPPSLTEWRKSGSYLALKAPRTVEFRTRIEQLPVSGNHSAIIQAINRRFLEEPVRFEKCAGRIAEMVLGQVTRIDFTRPSRDGGRDAVGKYRVGDTASGVEVDFALEAKCYSEGNGVGVRELSRLISRLRHRQFGVLVTTSFVASQAYKEIKEDQHPIVVIAARDIAQVLERHGLGTSEELERWLGQF